LSLLWPFFTVMKCTASGYWKPPIDLFKVNRFRHRAIKIALRVSIMIELWVPYPPSANNLWRSNRGRVHKHPKYTAWLTEAGIGLMSQRQAAGISGTYRLSLIAARPDKRRRDLDNLIKPISDLLVKAGFIDDDCLAQKIEAEWAESGDGVAIRLEAA
jgi:crossover junction endodeoxyribonuclease RusA